MLVFTRKYGESIMIGDIQVTVVQIKNNQVRIGVDAPREIPVHREEVYRLIKEKENGKAPDGGTAS